MATPVNTKQVGKYIMNADIDLNLGKTNNCVVFEGYDATSGDAVAAKMFTWAKDTQRKWWTERQNPCKTSHLITMY